MRPVPFRRALTLTAVAAVVVAGSAAAASAAGAGPATVVSSTPGAVGGSSPPWPGPFPGPVDQCDLPPGDTFDRGYFANERKADAAARAVGRWLARHPRARRALAGRWYSVSSHHGAYHVAFTRDAGAYQAALRKVAPDPARVCVSPALYSLAELDAAQARIERDLPWLERHGFGWLQLGVDEPTNTLVVGIPTEARGDAAQVLRARYGGTVAMRVKWVGFAEPAVPLRTLGG